MINKTKNNVNVKQFLIDLELIHVCNQLHLYKAMKIRLEATMPLDVYYMYSDKIGKDS